MNPSDASCACEIEPETVLPRVRFDYGNLRALETMDVVVADEVNLGSGLHRELLVRVYDIAMDDAAQGWVDVLLEGLAPSDVPTADVYSTGTVARVRVPRDAAGALLRAVIGWDAPAIGRLRVVMHRASTAPPESIELAVDLRDAPLRIGGDR